MSFRSNWRVLAVLTLLSGCAQSPQRAPQTQVSTPEGHCDQRWHLANSQKIRADAALPTRYAMDRNGTRCLWLVESREKVRYAVFQLPDYRAPWILEVASLMDGSRLFAPRVLLLDNKGRISRQVAFNRFSTRGHQIATNIFFKANDRAERYLLVHSEPEKVGQTSTRVVTGSFFIPLVNGLFPLLYRQGTDRQVEYTLSHNGLLSLHARSGGPKLMGSSGLHDVGRAKIARPMR